MGGSSSRPRKLTIENENALSVIKVSEDVVQRMKGKEGVRNQVVASPDVIAAPYLYVPSLSSIQIRQANIEALRDNDKYWDTRIERLQKSHQEMQQIMEEEFSKALSEATTRKKSPPSKTPLCMDRRKDIIACYKKYKDEPMRCAKEVQLFAECVDQKRASIIANRG